MWEAIVERATSMTAIFYMLLSVLIPWGIYRTNQWLHKTGDPPWKKNDTKKTAKER
jgi:hypothetical protein